MLVGIEAHGDTAAARRAELRRASDGELAARLAALARALRDVSAGPLARAAALPLAEVLASPYALRAVAMGVAVGATTRHRELCASLDWAQTLGAPPEVRDPDHGVWDRGVLRTGKYQGFLAEAPFATFDPSHPSKWGPHELMHRAAGFFFRPGLTRWELYLGARLNELVPVVLFYGPEQAMRLDEGAFDRAAAGREPSARIQDARWRDDDEVALRARALGAAPLLRAGLEHFERELGAIDEERASGRRVRVPHPVLDASSDATAYVVGHYERLRSPVVAAVLEATPEDARADTIDVYRERVEDVFDRLLFGELDADLAAPARARREAWDRLLRAAHLGADVEPLVDAIADGRDVRPALRRELVEEEAAAVLEDGSAEGRCLAQLGDGLEQVAPCTLALLDDASAIAAFADSEAILARAPLSARFERWLGEAPGASERPAVRAMARFERALVEARRDDAIERLCVPVDEVPQGPLGGWLVRSEGAERLALSHDVLGSHAAWAEGERRAPGAIRSEVLVVASFDEIAVVPVPRAVAEAWEAMDGATTARAFVEALDAHLEPEPAAGWPEDGEAWARELLLAGALGWRPWCDPEEG